MGEKTILRVCCGTKGTKQTDVTEADVVTALSDSLTMPSVSRGGATLSTQPVSTSETISKNKSDLKDLIDKATELQTEGGINNAHAEQTEETVVVSDFVVQNEPHYLFLISKELKCTQLYLVISTAADKYHFILVNLTTEDSMMDIVFSDADIQHFIKGKKPGSRAGIPITNPDQIPQFPIYWPTYNLIIGNPQPGAA